MSARPKEASLSLLSTYHAKVKSHLLAAGMRCERRDSASEGYVSEVELLRGTAALLVGCGLITPEDAESPVLSIALLNRLNALPLPRFGSGPAGGLIDLRDGVRFAGEVLAISVRETERKP